MQLGHQLVAPDGFGQLAKGENYHFLKSDARSQRALLVCFNGMNDSKPDARLFIVPRGEFEDALLAGKIISASKQSSLPPWLEELEDIDLSLIDLFRPRAKHQHRDRVESRMNIIHEAINDADSILSAEDPTERIHAYARSCRPPQNESRFRVWFLTYLCFGRNEWVLLPPFHRSGKWDRFDLIDKKLGRHSIAFGPGHGYRLDEDTIKKLLDGYEKYSGPKKKMTQIYASMMLHVFKCRTLKSPIGMRRYVQPEGLPFPSYRQFCYRVHKEYGIKSIQNTLYGEVRHRARCASSVGSFAEAVANLMERIEADGYYTEESPRGYIEGSSLPPLCVVCSRDVLSGFVLGIGFSLEKERGTAYRMMLFCMAVPKDFFGKLFGIKISKEDWPSQGLPPFLIVDRGPGAKRDLVEDIEKRLPIRDMAPSWSGQSKATIESSHPRDTHIEGQPTYVKSTLTPIELAKKQIARLMRYNESANMQGRMQPDTEMTFVLPSPLGLWNYYDERFRNDAQPMSIDDAVRTFLTPVEVLVKKDGVWLFEQKYDSPELRATGILDAVARSSTTRIKAFVLDLCVRYIWVEIDRRILMLDAMMRIRGDDEILYVSMAELEQWGEARRKVMSEFHEHQHASASEYMAQFEQAVGEHYDSGHITPGKRRADATTHQEEQEARHTTQPQKRHK